jgi:hypothetical protein
MNARPAPCFELELIYGIPNLQSANKVLTGRLTEQALGGQEHNPMNLIDTKCSQKPKELQVVTLLHE